MWTEKEWTEIEAATRRRFGPDVRIVKGTFSGDPEIAGIQRQIRNIEMMPPALRSHYVKVIQAAIDEAVADA